MTPTLCFTCADVQQQYGAPPPNCRNRNCANYARKPVKGLPGKKRRGRRVKGIVGGR